MTTPRRTPRFTTTLPEAYKAALRTHNLDAAALLRDAIERELARRGIPFTPTGKPREGRPRQDGVVPPTLPRAATGKDLRRQRRALDLTQAELAALTGVSRSTVAMAEQGASSVPAALERWLQRPRAS